MSLLLALAGGGSGPGTQTWTGSAGTILISGTPGAFSSGPQVWVGSTGTITITGSSGSFIGGTTPAATGGGAARPRMRYERVPKPEPFTLTDNDLAALALVLLEV